MSEIIYGRYDYGRHQGLEGGLPAAEQKEKKEKQEREVREEEAGEGEVREGEAEAGGKGVWVQMGK